MRQTMGTLSCRCGLMRNRDMCSRPHSRLHISPPSMRMRTMSVWFAWTVKQPSSSTHVAMFFAVTHAQKRSCTILSCVPCATLQLQSLGFAVGPRSTDLKVAPCAASIFLVYISQALRRDGCPIQLLMLEFLERHAVCHCTRVKSKHLDMLASAF